MIAERELELGGAEATEFGQRLHVVMALAAGRWVILRGHVLPGSFFRSTFAVAATMGKFVSSYDDGCAIALGWLALGSP
jgi:hypothetical protein